MGLIAPSRVHRARGCDGTEKDGKCPEPEMASGQAFRNFAQVTTAPAIGLTRRPPAMELLGQSESSNCFDCVSIPKKPGRIHSPYTRLLRSSWTLGRGGA